MNRNCKICWIILGLFLIGNLAILGVWFIKDDDHRPYKNYKYKKEDHRDQMRHHLREKAGVDNEQFEDMYRLWKEHGKRMYQYQNEVDSLKRQLMELTLTTDHKDSTVKTLLDELADKHRTVEEINYKHIRKMRAVCKTDEQREMLDKMFRGFMNKPWDERRHRNWRRGSHRHSH